MALTIKTEPVTLLPAYTPVKYTLTTDRLPNSIAGESAIPIVSIGKATPLELATYATLRSTDVVVRHGTVAANTFQPGQVVLIEATSGAKYVGKYTVTKEIDVDRCVIETGDNGTDIGGTIGVYYEGLQCFARVVLNNGVQSIPVAEPHRLTPNEAGEIEFDVRAICQRAMDMTVDDPTITGSVMPSLHYLYVRVTFYEGYLEPFAGKLVYTIDDTETVIGREHTVIMAAQPFVHTLAGQVYEYADMLDPFKVLTTSNARFLTHRPRGEAAVVGRDDHARLDFLIAKNPGVDVAMTVKVLAYNGAGVADALNTIAFTATGHHTYYIACGPADLDPSFIPSTSTSYRVFLEAGGIQVSEAILFRIEPRTCDGPQLQVFWRNRLGGMDSHYFGGPLTVAGASESVITQRAELVSGSYDGLRTVRSRTSQQIHTLQTDYVSPEVQQWLASELCQSPQAFILDPEHDQYIPIIIESGEAQAYGVRGDRVRYVISYRHSTETVHHIR